MRIETAVNSGKSSATIGGVKVDFRYNRVDRVMKVAVRTLKAPEDNGKELLRAVSAYAVPRGMRIVYTGLVPQWLKNVLLKEGYRIQGSEGMSVTSKSEWQVGRIRRDPPKHSLMLQAVRELMKEAGVEFRLTSDSVKALMVVDEDTQADVSRVFTRATRKIRALKKVARGQ